MYSVDHRGQYPGSSSAFATDPGFTAGGAEQPYMNAAPTCPSAGTATYVGQVSQNPPGFYVNCGGTNHDGAGVAVDFPGYGSDVGGLRTTPATAAEDSSFRTATDVLNITFLHI